MQEDLIKPPNCRQILPCGSVRRRTLCGKLLPNDREYVQPSNQVQWPRFRYGDRRYSWSGTHSSVMFTYLELVNLQAVGTAF